MAEYVQLPEDMSGLAAIETTGEWRPFWKAFDAQRY